MMGWKSGRAFVFAAAAVAVASLAGCQTTGGTDNSGKAVSVDEWRAAPSADSYLDLPDRLPGIDVKLEKQMRDNSIYHQRFWLDGRKGQVFMQAVVTGAWFDHRSKTKIDNPDEVMAAARKDSPAKVPADATPTRIGHRSKRVGGWYIIYPGRKDGETCVMAAPGYVFRENRYDNDDGTGYDTTLFARYCGSRQAVDQLVVMLGTTVPRR